MNHHNNHPIETAMTQADCVVWDESNNIDLRALDSQYEEMEFSILQEDESGEDPHSDDGDIGGRKLFRADDDDDEENINGIVHPKNNRRRRKRKRQQDFSLTPPSVAISKNRRLSSGSTASGNSGLANLLKQVSTPAPPPNSRCDCEALREFSDQHSSYANDKMDSSLLSPNLEAASSNVHGVSCQDLASPQQHLPPASVVFSPADPGKMASRLDEEEKDEFGIGDWSMEDFAQIDAMVNVATQQVDDTTVVNTLAAKLAATTPQQKLPRINPQTNPEHRLNPRGPALHTVQRTTASKQSDTSNINKKMSVIYDGATKENKSAVNSAPEMRKPKLIFGSKAPVPQQPLHEASLNNNISPSMAPPIAIQSKRSNDSGKEHGPGIKSREVAAQQSTFQFDDEFDFPEVDFEALDKSVEVHFTQQQQTQGRGTEVAVPQKDLSMLTEDELGELVPPRDTPVVNKRRVQSHPPNYFMSFDRYQVIRTRFHMATYTQILVVAKWQGSLRDEDKGGRSCVSKIEAQHGDGMIFLRGEWFHSQIEDGNFIHICSLTGKFETGPTALPLLMDTTPCARSTPDDLVLIIHPDTLLTPTTISETVTCNRRAVLKIRMGSTGLSSSAPLFGTMRHKLFQECLRTQDFSEEFVKKQIDAIIRHNAEDLLACKVTSLQAESELYKSLPQMSRFVREFTKFGNEGISTGGLLSGHGNYSPLNLLVENVDLIEDMIVSQELGLKGAVDVLVTASTARENYKGGPSDQTTSLVCVELKTGHNQRAQHAHLAQLVIYILMVHARYGPTANDDGMGSGVLLYINNEGLHPIHVSPFMAEIKSLIGQRNAVATEQLRASKPRGIEYLPVGDGSEEVRRKLSHTPPPARLPALISSANTCKNCYTNRECMVYAAAERASQIDIGLASCFERHADMMAKFAGHLTKEDFDYFQTWDRLIDVEVHSSTFGPATSWLVPSEEREKATGKSISSLVCASVNSPLADNPSAPSIICFERSRKSSSVTPLVALGFEKGCHVVLSMDCTSVAASAQTSVRTYRPHMHIVRGIIDSITEQSVFLRASVDDVARLSRILARRKDEPKPLLFRLDRDEVATGVGTLRQNLINLFAEPSNNEEHVFGKGIHRNAKLRRLLVNLEPPRFESKLKSTMFSPPFSAPLFQVPGCNLEDLCAEFYELNPDQQAAAERVLSAQDYALIQGLPGTGKTSTIAYVVRLLVAHGKRVLVTSFTNSAVDNVLLKLIQLGLGIPGQGQASPCLLRVGLKSSCHPDIVPFLASEVAASIEGINEDSDVMLPRPESLKATLLAARVVGATALSIPRSPLLELKEFDVVIVDEAGQINQPAIIGALQAAGTFVLVGDHMQLPPLVQSELAEDGGFGNSMLKRLADRHPSAVSQLTLQYRMAENICQLSNDIIYKGKLRCATKLVSSKRLALRNIANSSLWPSWIKMAIEPARTTVFVNTDTVASEHGGVDFVEHKLGKRGAVVNETEVTIAKILVEKFVALGVEASAIGIISPYRSQVCLLEKDQTLEEFKKKGLELSTIDRYQGRDKDVIILSLVRSNKEGRVGRLLADARRLNVAVTRAKCKLVIVGSFSTLHNGSEPLVPALKRIRDSGGVVSFAC